MPFDNVLTTNFSQFSGNTLTIPDTNALYWMHIGVEVPAGTKAHIQVTGTSLSIWKTHTALNDFDSMTSDGFVQTSQGTKLTLSTDYATVSSPYLQPYWVGFRLDNYFTSLVAFSVALSTQFGVLNGVVPFDIILLNIGNGWQQDGTYQFVPPRAGIYYFKFSGGVAYNRIYLLGLQINGQNPCSFQTGVAHFVPQNVNSPFDTFDVVSRSCMVEMATTDTAAVYLLAKMVALLDTTYYVISSATYQQTSFSGFLYSPLLFTGVSMIFIKVGG